MTRLLLALAALTLFLSCGDDITGPPTDPPLVKSEPRAIVLTSDPTGPLSDPASLTFDAFVEAYESQEDAGSLVIGLPLAGLPAGSPIAMDPGFVEIDPGARTVSVAGFAPFHGTSVLIALVGVWDGNGEVPAFTLAIRVDAADMAAIVPGVAGTPLADLEFPGAAVILSEQPWDLPASPPEALHLIAPGLTAIPAGASLHGAFAPPPALARALELIPSLPDALPLLQGGFGLDASAVLAGPDGPPVDALEGLEMEAVLPTPAEPVGPMRVDAHVLTARWLDGGVVLTLETDVRLDVDGAERPFEFTLEIDARAAGAASLTGHLTEPWPAPFGLDWLAVDSVGLRLAGSADDRELTVTAAARLFDDFRAAMMVDTEGPELRLALTGALDAAGVVDLVNDVSGLAGDAAIRLPEGGPTLREVSLTLRPESTSPVVLEGTGTLLEGVDAGAILTLVRIDGALRPLFGFHMGPGLIGSLVPPLKDSDLDRAVPGGTIVIPIADGTVATIDRASLAPAARAFFDAAYRGIQDYSIELSSVIRLDAPLELSAVPQEVATVLGLDVDGHAILGGFVGTTLRILTGSADIQLDSLGIAATIPFAGPSAGLPDWLQPRSHAFSYHWDRVSDERRFVLASRLMADLDTDSLALDLDVDLSATPSGSGTVSLRGRAGRWEHPWDLHWLAVDSVILTLDGDPDSARVDLGADLTVAGVPTRVQVAATDQGEPELTLSVQPELTMDSVARVAGELGGVSGAVTVRLPDGGPSLREITATVRPGARAPFTLIGTGAIRGGEVAVSAMLTLIHEDEKVTPVLVLRTGETSLATLFPALGDGSSLDLPLPGSGISVPTLDGATLTLPSEDLAAAARDFLAPIFDGVESFNLHVEAAIRLDAPVPLDVIPEAIASKLALDRAGNAHLGGSVGLQLQGLTAGDISADSVRLFAAVPRKGKPSFQGWPHWLTPRRDSIAVYWRRDPALSQFTLQSAMEAELGGSTLPFEVRTDLSSSDAGDRVELSGRTGTWHEPFGVGWLDVDSLSLRFVSAPDTTLVELSTDVHLLGRGAGLSIAVDDGGNGELELTLESLATADIRQLLDDHVPDLDLAASFPDFTVSDAFVYVRAGDGEAFSIGGNAAFLEKDVSLLVSVARGASGSVILGGLRMHDFSLEERLQAEGVDLGENAAAFLDVFAFDTAAIVFSTAEVGVADSVLDRHALDFYRSAFGQGQFAIPLKSGITVVARRVLPPDGQLASVAHSLSPNGDDRAITVSARIPGLLIGASDGESIREGLRFELALPPMVADTSRQWLRYGQLHLVLTGAPSVGLDGTLGLKVDGHDLDFTVGAELTATGGGAVQLRAAADTDQDWVEPFDVKGLTLRRVGLDLWLDALSVGMCIGGALSIGAQDIDGAVGVALQNATGAPIGGLFFAKSDRGLALEDLATLQSAMVEGDPLSLRSLPPMRVDSFEVLVAVGKAAKLDLACTGDREPGPFALKGNLWARVDPSRDMEKLAFVDLDFSSGIVARGAFASGAIGPISWTEPKLDLQIDRADQHLIVHGGADIAAALEVDPFDLTMTRDSLAFELDMEIYEGFGADIGAAADPDLMQPDFHVHGRMEGAFVEALSTRLYDGLARASRSGHALLDNLRSNSAGADLETALAGARIVRQAAYDSWQAAEDWLRTLRSERAACVWDLCRARYDARIAVWERIRNVRKARYDTADRVLRTLERAETLAKELDAALAELDRWRSQGRLVLSEAGFHTDLAHLLEGRGLTVHIDGSIDGAPMHVVFDTDATFAENTAAIVHHILPPSLAMLLP